MDTSYTPKNSTYLIFGGLMVVGLIALITGFASDAQRTWNNILLNNYYFLTIAMGALFFYCLQFITNTGWSALFQRVPLALGYYLFPSALIMLLLYFGLPHIYEWAIPGITETDKLIAHKEPFLNIPFFMIRMVIYFALFMGAVWMLRKYAKQQDNAPELKNYNQSRYYAQVFIFIFAIFFSFASKDWIMTIDSHWYSTLFGFRNMLISGYYGSAVIILTVLFLRRKGFFSKINDAHYHDLARYLYRFSIVFGYMWFMQFIITWYANIPELTVYYNPRFLGDFQIFFWGELILNFIIPFLVMMSNDLGKKPVTLISISIVILIGLWVNIYAQIMPGAMGIVKFGFIEIGMWLGFAGLFLLSSFYALSKLKLTDPQHPYMEESEHHHV